MEAKLRLLEERVERAEILFSKIQKKVGKQSSNSQDEDSKDTLQVTRVKQDLKNRNVFTCRFVRVVGDYYERPLEFRASLLNCQTSQLCKSIVFENTACDHTNIDDRTNSRFYCVITQYEGTSPFEIYLHINMSF